MGAIVGRQVGCVQFPIIHLPLCSGQGRCMLTLNGTEMEIDIPNLPNSQCVCSAGWTGYNDWVSEETHDCGIHTLTIFIIWCLILVGAICASSLMIWKLFHSYDRFKELRQALGGGAMPPGGGDRDYSQEHSSHTLPSPEKGEVAFSPTPSSAVRTFKIEGSPPTKQQPPQHPSTGGSSSPPRSISPTRLRPAAGWKVFFGWRVVHVCVQTLLPTLALAVLAIYRMIYPLRAIGSDVPATVLYNIAIMGSRIVQRFQALSWLDLRKKLIRFTAADQKRAEQAIHRMNNLLRYTFIPEVIEIVLSLVLCFTQEEANLVSFLLFHTCVITSFLGVYGFYTGGKAVAQILSTGLDISKGTQKSSREKALSRINKVLLKQKQAAQSTVPYVLMLAWFPFLRSKVAYSFVLLALPPMSMAAQAWLVHPPASIFADKVGSDDPELRGGGSRQRGGKELDSSGGGGLSTKLLPTSSASTIAAASSSSGQDILVVDTGMNLQLALSPSVEEGAEEVEEGGGEEERRKEVMENQGGVEMEVLTPVSESTAHHFSSTTD